MILGDKELKPILALSILLLNSVFNTVLTSLVILKSISIEFSFSIELI